MWRAPLRSAPSLRSGRPVVCSCRCAAWPLFVRRRGAAVVGVGRPAGVPVAASAALRLFPSVRSLRCRFGASRSLVTSLCCVRLVGVSLSSRCRCVPGGLRPRTFGAVDEAVACRWRFPGSLRVGRLRVLRPQVTMAPSAQVSVRVGLWRHVRGGFGVAALSCRSVPMAGRGIPGCRPSGMGHGSSQPEGPHIRGQNRRQITHDGCGFAADGGAGRADDGTVPRRAPKALRGGTVTVRHETRTVRRRSRNPVAERRRDDDGTWTGRAPKALPESETQTGRRRRGDAAPGRWESEVVTHPGTRAG